MMKKIFNILSCTLLLASSALAEEGMWPFNMIPLKQINQTYDIALDQGWVDHAQKSCVRISLGGSGSFVSAKGLVLTNAHVALQAIYNLSTPERDLVADGFYAATQGEEIRCPAMYIDQLISIQDITAQVNQAIATEKTDAAKEEARQKVFARIKQEQKEATGLQPEVVTLYGGAKHHLYLYKRYTDVRLVMAPENQIAFFGQQIDNFEYPRYNLDMCFFRVYDKGEPLSTADNYFKWSSTGPKAAEALFVIGHPGRTERICTSDHLQFIRDMENALQLRFIAERREALESFASKSPENLRIASQKLSQLGNGQKVYEGRQQSFKVIPIVENKKKHEQTFFKDVDKQPWNDIRASLKKMERDYPSYAVLEGGCSNYCQLYIFAKTLVRLAAERKKPDQERLKEYTETELPSVKQMLLSDIPIYPSLETVNLAVGLRFLAHTLGNDHPLVKQIVQGKTAEELIATSRLHEVSFRQELYAQPEKIGSCEDSLVRLAMLIDPVAREVRKKKEGEHDGLLKSCYEQIAENTFKKLGESVYPDATFTLRLSVGTLKGYEEEGQVIDPVTTYAGLFERAEAKGSLEEFRLPSRWKEKESLLCKGTAFNFASTHDLIGGNSGSPVINAKRELVGLIFDGNRQSLSWDFAYDDRQGRAVSVHSAGILEALKTVYEADSLVDELQTKE